MNTIDRYLLRQFLRIFVIAFVSLLGVFIIGDFVSNMSKFLEFSAKQGLAPALASYYSARIPWFFELTGRVLVLLAAVMSVAWLRRHNELTAIMAAGIPRRRIALPLLCCGVGLSLLAAFNREVTLPRVRSPLCRSAKDLIEGRAEQMQPRYDNEQDVLLTGRSVYAAEERIARPRLRLPFNWDGMGNLIAAENAFYLAPDQGRTGGYLLDEVANPEVLQQTPTRSVNGRVVLFSPHDQAWLEPDQCFFASNLVFEQMIHARQWQQYSSTRQLLAGLRNPSLDYGADVRVLVHSRFVQPALDVCLLLIGLPLAFWGNRTHVFLSAGKCLMVAALFIVGTLISQNLGIHCLIRPPLAAWLPLLVAVPVAVAMTNPLWD